MGGDHELPELMRAAVLDHDGALRVERIPVPRPGPGEALIRVAACGLCHSDLHVLKDEIAFPRPCVLGHEISGTVVALGDAAETRFAPGDRVVGGFIMPCERCAPCLAGRDDLCTEFFEKNRLAGTLYDGASRLARRDGQTLAMYSMAGMAEYCVAPLGALAPLPEGLPREASAILGCAVMTAYGAVTRTAGIRPGSTVAVVAAGGIGLSIVQLARGLGAATVIAVDVQDDKLALAARLGASHTVNGSVEDPVAAVRRITDGAGVDFAFEALGRAETLEQTLRMLAVGGRSIAVGLAAGSTTAAVEITPLVRRGQGLLGSYGARTRTDLPAVAALAAEGRFDIAASVSRGYPLDEVARAFDDLASGRVVGRAIITMEAAA